MSAERCGVYAALSSVPSAPWAPHSSHRCGRSCVSMFMDAFVRRQHTLTCHVGVFVCSGIEKESIQKEEEMMGSSCRAERMKGDR